MRDLLCCDSAASRGISSVVKVPAGFGRPSSRYHASANPFATAANGIIGSTTNHLMGGFTAVANEAIRPDGDVQGAFATTAVNGILSGRGRVRLTSRSAPRGEELLT